MLYFSLPTFFRAWVSVSMGCYRSLLDVVARKWLFVFIFASIYATVDNLKVLTLPIVPKNGLDAIFSRVA